MRKKVTIACLILALLFTLFHLRKSWFARYEVIELPVVEGYVESSGLMINNRGFVVGECVRANPDPDDAEERINVIWGPGLQPDPLPINGFVNALNDANQVAGYVGNSTSHQACVYDSTSGLRLIEIPDATQTWGCDINNRGMVLVYGTVVSSTRWKTNHMVGWDMRNETEIFRSPLWCTWVDLELNNNGIVAGIVQRSTPSYGDLFIYDPSNGIKVLKEGLRNAGGVNLHDTGAVSFYGNHANYLLSEGEVIRVGEDNGKPLISRFYGVDAKNRLVGFDFTERSKQWFEIGFLGRSDWIAKTARWLWGDRPYELRTIAVLWEGKENQDLNDLIPSDSGWFLEAAFDINDRGEIVGRGYNPNGEERGFLLRPIEGVGR